MTAGLPIHLVAEGTTGRVVVLCHPDPGDPDPEMTWSRGVTLLGVDPTEFGRWDADELAEALDRRGAGPVGAVGWSDGGLVALALAARHPELVDRLVVIGTPSPGPDPTQVTAKTLLLYGAKDPIAGPRDGKWYQQRLPNARYEQVPGEGRLLVGPMWRRALSHLAPNHRRATTR
jgi:pimeloyl-ACP methyl ester carboxylesterase